ncbi:MAG: serine dehydratase subunit alpha family protein [Clostridiales bacterium]|nr:serine dehydratase subunit alpha family protein [Clostridiales bacterium]
MEKTDIRYRTYLQILKEELVPAMGCTEPIAISYCAAKARAILGMLPERSLVEVSGNIIKNVKSVIVPNTNGLKGIGAAAAAGIVAGDAERILEVIAGVNEEQKEEIREYLERGVIQVRPLDTEEILDIVIHVYGGGHEVTVRIANYHTNIVLIRKDGETLYEIGGAAAKEETNQADRNLLRVEDIVEFADTADPADVEELLSRQIRCNSAIAREGLANLWGANVGKVLLRAYGDDVKVRARAMAAAGSDARMSGCEMAVIINSGSGNQGMAASLPVIEYAAELKVSQEKLYRALLVSNLITIHQKTGIGRLSAYCGAVSAGCGAGCGIAYLHGGDFRCIAHTLVNALAIVSGIVCDGAKPSCAGKIAAAVDAGILGYEMYCEGQQFRGGDGILSKGVENTIRNIGRLGSVGMKETDKEIIQIMTDC